MKFIALLLLVVGVQSRADGNCTGEYGYGCPGGPPGQISAPAPAPTPLYSGSAAMAVFYAMEQSGYTVTALPGFLGNGGNSITGAYNGQRLTCAYYYSEQYGYRTMSSAACVLAN